MRCFSTTVTRTWIWWVFSLYCEEVDVGEPQPRKIASGLREHIALDQFEGQKVLVLCNMKEKKLRGFASHGMILCGKSVSSSQDGKEQVELVKPPADCPVLFSNTCFISFTI